MKWNSNVSLKTMEHDPDNKLFGNLYGKVMVNKDIPFPEDSDLKHLSEATKIEKHYPDLINPNLSQTQELKPISHKKQINREFFKGHKYPVVFICHIENGKDMLTIDENCHIYIWKYEKKYLDQEGMFVPAYKYRFSLSYLRMKCK